MEIKGIIWIDEVLEKPLRKQNVRQHQVKEVLTNQPWFRFVEKGHRSGENVYVAMGRTDGGRYLIVFFVYKADKRAL